MAGRIFFLFVTIIFFLLVMVAFNLLVVIAFVLLAAINFTLRAIGKDRIAEILYRLVWHQA